MALAARARLALTCSHLDPPCWQAPMARRDQQSNDCHKLALFLGTGTLVPVRRRPANVWLVRRGIKIPT
jgi:hypothetical protein